MFYGLLLCVGYVRKCRWKVGRKKRRKPSWRSGGLRTASEAAHRCAEASSCFPITEENRIHQKLEETSIQYFVSLPWCFVDKITKWCIEDTSMYQWILISMQWWVLKQCLIMSSDQVFIFRFAPKIQHYRKKHFLGRNSTFDLDVSTKMNGGCWWSIMKTLKSYTVCDNYPERILNLNFRAKKQRLNSISFDNLIGEAKMKMRHFSNF